MKPRRIVKSDELVLNPSSTILKLKTQQCWEHCPQRLYSNNILLLATEASPSHRQQQKRHVAENPPLNELSSYLFSSSSSVILRHRKIRPLRQRQCGGGSYLRASMALTFIHRRRRRQHQVSRGNPPFHLLGRRWNFLW